MIDSPLLKGGVLKTALGLLDNDGFIHAPSQGSISEILINEGEFVEEEEILLAIDDLGIKVEVNAPNEGVIERILIEIGDWVEKDERLIKLNV